MSSVQLQRAARLADLATGLPLAVTLPDGQRICLVKDGERIFAIADRCTHKDFALSGGDLVAPCVLECPWHGARFDVRTLIPDPMPGVLQNPLSRVAERRVTVAKAT